MSRIIKMVGLMALIAAFGLASTAIASPPVPPPVEGFYIETNTIIDVNITDLNLDYAIYNWNGEENQIIQELYYEIPYDQLSFLKRGQNLYNANFQLWLTLTNTNGDTLRYKTWLSDVQVQNVETTHSDYLSVKNRITFQIESGEYSVEMKIQDTESAEIGIAKLDFTANTFAIKKPLDISEIGFISSIPQEQTNPNLKV